MPSIRPLGVEDAGARAAGADVDADEVRLPSPPPRQRSTALRQDHEVADRHAARPGQHEEHRLGHLLGLHQAARGQRLLHLRLRPVVEQRGHHRARAARRRRGCRASSPAAGRCGRRPAPRTSRRCRSAPRPPARRPAIELVTMMSPVLRSTMCGSTAWTERKAALTLRLQHAVPGVRVALDHVAADVGAGVGVEDVEAAGRARGCRGSIAETLGAVQQVDDQRMRLRPELGAERVAACPRPGRSARPSAPAASIALRAGEPDPRGRAGDRRDLAVRVRSLMASSPIRRGRARRGSCARGCRRSRRWRARRR